MPSAKKDAKAYARHYIDLDAGRRVLQCHGCEAREPWSDAARAVALGWAYSDAVVSGRRIRFWHCPSCKKPEPWQPLATPHPAQDARDMSSEPFGGRRVVIVRFGASMTQIAVVLEEREASVDVVAWSAGPMTFRKPKTVPREKVIGAAGPNDKRVRAARDEWPKFFARELAPKLQRAAHRKRKPSAAKPPMHHATSLVMEPCEPGSLLHQAQRFL